MIEIVSSFAPNAEKTTILERALIRKTANKAIETIKNELPEEVKPISFRSTWILHLQM